MHETFWKFTALTALLAVSISSSSQSKPSVPISELSVIAGRGFGFDIDLAAPFLVPLSATATYRLDSPNKSGNVAFSCQGAIQGPGNILHFDCAAVRNAVPGVYRSDDPINVVAYPYDGERTRSQTYPEKRRPIVTVLPPDPYPPTPLPVLVGEARLTATPATFLLDGSLRAKDLLDEVSGHFPSRMANNRETRAYLLAQVKAAETIVESTRSRYMKAMNGNGTPEPIFFEDFKLRLEQVETDLQGLTRGSLREDGPSSVPRLILVQAQRPKMTDSVNASDKENALDKQLVDFYKILIDAVKGWRTISESESREFTWSVTTVPAGAKIWISWLGQPEKPWPAPTNLKDLKLPYATWTFRFDWNGCSVKITPDPYTVHPLDIVESKTECKTN